MKNLTSFDNFLNESQLQNDYREFFSKLLNLYGIKSPAQFKGKEELAAKFYKDIEKGWSKGNGLTQYGKKLMEKDKLEESINESTLQNNYRDFFSKLLELYGIKSPLEFKHKEKLSEKFYKDVEKGWANGKGLTEYGKKLMKLDELEDLEE
jgi:hypothetical protein